MASLPHNAEASHLTSSHLSSFEGSLINGEYHYQQTPVTCQRLPPTDFEAHFQEIHGQESWRVPTIHHEQPNRSSSSSPFERLAVENCGAQMFSSYADSRHGFADMAAESWNGKLSHLLACANGMDGNPMSPVPHGYLSEGASLAEMMANNPSNVGPKGGTSPLNGFSHLSPFFGKHFNYNLGINCSNVGLAVDPSKGGLAIQDVNLLAGQSSLCNLPVNPTFADKTAKFAFFNKPASLLSPAAELSQDAANQLMREGGNSNTSAIQPMMLRMPSGLGTPSSSTSNSPSGREVLQQSAVRSRQEMFNSVAIAKADPHANGYSNTVVLEESKYVSSKKRSLLPTLVEIDGSEGMAKQCTSIDESDESIGPDITSSCERDNGWETTSNKKKRTKDRSKSSAVRQLTDVTDVAGEEVNDKWHKGGDDIIEDDPNKKVEQSNDSDESMHLLIKDSSKPPEAPKPDYIHVRARRGQATDSHSLAERIRREKISERMKFLQDLVPGCSKITGKAVMLDEIINYVQSLQRQVEFLSMKLAAVNPRVEFNMDNLLRRDIFQPQVPPSHQPLIFSAENPHSYKPMQHQQSQAPSRMGGHGVVSHPPIDVHSLGKSDSALRTIVSTPIASKEPYGDIISQASQAWDDELQNVVQMSFAQGRQTPLTSPILQGPQPFAGKLKPEI